MRHIQLAELTIVWDSLGSLWFAFCVEILTKRQLHREEVSLGSPSHTVSLAGDHIFRPPRHHRQLCEYILNIHYLFEKTWSCLKPKAAVAMCESLWDTRHHHHHSSGAVLPYTSLSVGGHYGINASGTPGVPSRLLNVGKWTYFSASEQPMRWRLLTILWW